MSLQDWHAVVIVVAYVASSGNAAAVGDQLRQTWRQVARSMNSDGDSVGTCSSGRIEGT